MYQTDLTQYGYDVASQFVSALIQAKPLEMRVTAEATDAMAPIDTATHSEGTTIEGDPSSKTMATEKCQVKSSTKEHPSPVHNSHG